MIFEFCIEGRVGFLQVEKGKYRENWGWRGKQFVGSRACKSKKEGGVIIFYKLTLYNLVSLGAVGKISLSTLKKS